MGKLQLGKLQHKVSFYRDATVIHPQTGEQELEVQTIKENRWGSVKYIGSPSAGSSEEELNDQRTGKIKIEVVCRFFPGLRFEDWIEFEGGRFRIYSIQTLGRNEGYSLRAELRDDDSPMLPTGAILDANAETPQRADMGPLIGISEVDGLQAALNAIQADVDQNETDSDNADANLQTNIDNVQTIHDIPAVANDALIHNGASFVASPLSGIVQQATLSTQGYYGLLTNFYFTGGSSTTTTIDTEDVGYWKDVEFNLQDPGGLFDNRPLAMQEANANGHTGTGAAGDPIVFSLEGLDTHAFANFRASMSFVPETDEGQLETRLLFERHSGTVPNDQFPIEEVTLSMEQGADIHYPAEPMLSFFVGDTIDTNAPGDAGSCRFQVKSSVEGVVHMRALTWYLNV